MADAPEIKRGLFGYHKDAVEALLAERERMFLQVSKEARDAEQRLEAARQVTDSFGNDLAKARQELEALTGELERTKARVAELETNLTVATSQLAEQSERAREADQRLEAREASLLDRITELEAELEQARSTPRAGVGELTAVLDATRDAVERIMADARRSAEDQLADMQRTRENLQSEIERASSWREQVSPLIEGVRREIGRTQAQVVQVGARVSEAMRPVTDALSTLERNLDDLDRAAATEAPATPTSANRVDLLSDERTEDESQTEPAAPEPPPAAHEIPAWRGGEGRRTAGGAG